MIIKNQEKRYIPLWSWQDGSEVEIPEQDQSFLPNIHEKQLQNDYNSISMGCDAKYAHIHKYMHMHTQTYRQK